jgi:hypothetical protein
MDWTEEGRRIGVTLDAFHAVVVAGSDPVATAEAALGIARVQAAQRRVALGDLLGDAEPIQALVQGDDPHGLVDSFLYGVSLTKIARKVPDAGELFVMPTGTGPVDYDELFGNPRWRRLIAGFREMGALLIIAVPAEAPRVHELVAASDGVVIVGDVVPPEVSVAQSLAWIRARRGVVPPTTQPTGEDEAPASPSQPVVASAGRDRPPMWVVAALVLAVLAIAAFLGTRIYSQRQERQRVAADSTARAVALRVRQTDSVARARRDSIARDSVNRAAADAIADSFPVYTPANPRDSASAVGYSVLLSKYNTKSGAILDLFGRFSTLPVATYGMETPSRFYLLLVGAFPTRAGADSMLARMRGGGTIGMGFGSVERYPLAFLVDSALPPRQVPPRLTRYAARGLPIYALRQPNGTVRLYFGAYASAEQASLAVPQLRASGIRPLLVYRTGRVF